MAEEFTRTIRSINDDSYWRCLEITYQFPFTGYYHSEITITTPTLTPEYLDIADKVASSLAKGHGNNEFHSREPLAEYTPYYRLTAYMPSDNSRIYAENTSREMAVFKWIRDCMEKGVTKFKIEPIETHYADKVGRLYRSKHEAIADQRTPGGES